MLYWGLTVCMFGLFIMCFKSDHLLMIFLGMETIALGFFMLVSYLSSSTKLFLLLFVMSVSVIEAAVMLSILVMTVRSYGSDTSVVFLADKS